MTIVNSLSGTKTIAYFNRFGVVPTFVKITNEGTQVSDIYPVDALTNESYYSILTFTATFVLDTFYMMEILGDEDEVVFRDKVFCTNSPSDYSINANEYKEHSTTNEYIIYE